MEKMARLYMGNSQNMDKVANNAVDFIFTGPPYWNHLEYSEEEMQLGNVDDYEQFHLEIAKVWAECYRVLKPGAVLCTQTNDLYVHDGQTIEKRIPLTQDFSRHIMQQGFIPLNIIFWDNYLPVKSKQMPKEERQGARSHHIITQRMQYLSFFCKKPDVAVSAVKYKHALTDYYWKPSWQMRTRRKLLGSSLLYTFVSFIITILPIEGIWNRSIINKIKDKAVKDFRRDSKYPAASDHKIVERILGDFTEPGDLILDPFAGSGTTLAVAYSMGRQSIGYEINRSAVDIVKSKLKDNVHII